MRDRNKTENEHMVELNELRERNAELEAREGEHRLARKTLERSEMLLRKVFDTIPDLVAVIDSNYRILISNWHGGYEYVPEEARSGNPVCHEAYYGRKTLCEPCHVREVFSTGRPVGWEKLNPNIGQVEIRAFPIFDESGNVELVMEHIRDITAWRHAEEELRQAKEEWERTFDAIVDPVMIADSQHKIIKVNKAMADKLGISPADAEGLACYNAVHGAAEPPLFCPHSELLADGKPHSIEIHEERLGGYFIVSVSPLFNPQGEVYRSVHYAKDITKRIKAEESVQNMNEELERRVEERTKQLLEAQEELLRKEKLAILGQLSGSVGHELRNPLGVMNNSIYFLKTLMPDGDETVMEYLDIIKHEIDNSERIITDLLDFARTKTPRKMAVMVGDLMEVSLERCALPENVDVQSDIPDKLPPLNVDPLQMQQVFQNLISNAVQAMPEGGHLRISARSVQSSKFKVQGSEENNIEHRTLNVEPDTDVIEISVEDTGVGISPENMKKLFHPLFTTRAKGIGLGLMVCRNLTEANGGRIEVESELGKGTRFVILLPMEG